MPNIKRSDDGKFTKHATYVDMICENCNKTFTIKQSSLKYGRGRCCSRICVDENKKKTYIGEKNPNYGVIYSEERKKAISERTKLLWETDDYREAVKKSMDVFFERAANDGTWERAIAKREQTFLKKYGISHNWNGKYGERQCDKTTLELYGKMPHEIRNDGQKQYGYKTSIETIVENIFIEMGIHILPQYCLDGYYFDIYVPSLNVLIECDGDYWHGYNLLDEELDVIQTNNRKNDVVKNNIAHKHNIKLYRFWEHEIHQNNFKEDMIKQIWQK
jgi:very-short-patch-repair endonuclease